MKDYHITLTVKNNYLLQAMKAAGFSTAAQFSRATGVSQQIIGGFLNLKIVPAGTRGWGPAILKISKFLKMLPEDLFPPEHIYKPLEHNKISSEINRSEINQIAASYPSAQLQLEFEESRDTITKALDTLSDREQGILMDRFGFNGKKRTLKELSKKYEISSSRIREIEKTSLHKLRCGHHDLEDRMDTVFSCNS